MTKRLAGWLVLFFSLACCTIPQMTVVSAETLQSPNYKLDESAIGTSNLNQSSSTSYVITDATGALAIGNSASVNYQIEAGTKTTHDPTLSFSVNNADADFGVFTPINASVTTANFSISNYTSHGYVVQIFGDPPSYSGHEITAMATKGPSESGREQFGINLVANTLPVSFGTNPDNGQFGFGSVTANYSTSNQYRYVSGETIALAPKSSGITNYTISYLVNVSSITPGGQYTSGQTIIVTGTY
jgi:hypothetical protein